jgi:hypothetical protein
VHYLFGCPIALGPEERFVDEPPANEYNLVEGTGKNVGVAGRQRGGNEPDDIVVLRPPEDGRDWRRSPTFIVL